MKRALSLTVAVAAVLALGACKSNATTDHLKINAAAINGKPGFSVGTVTVTKGDNVDLRLGNNLPAAHGFSIDELGVHRVVQPHVPQEFSFKATKAGTFRIY